MSTPAMIAVPHPDGTPDRYLTIGVTYDGYPTKGEGFAGVGAILPVHYNTLALAQELVALGDLRSLGETITKGTHARHRDEGYPMEGDPPDAVGPRVVDGRDKLIKFAANMWGACFVYLFDGREWLMHDRRFDYERWDVHTSRGWRLKVTPSSTFTAGLVEEFTTAGRNALDEAAGTLRELVKKAGAERDNARERAEAFGDVWSAVFHALAAVEMAIRDFK